MKTHLPSLALFLAAVYASTSLGAMPTPHDVQPLATAPTMNFAGLSGAWISPSQPGSRMLWQVSTDAAAPGKLSFAGRWFTFDGMLASDERNQRWYSLQGELSAGTHIAQLSLYRTVGGNFDAASAVDMSLVGSATLTFADCNNATFEFHFNDAARGAETGGIDLRIPQNGSLVLQRQGNSAACSGAASAVAVGGLSGAWSDPAKSGQGVWFDVDAQDGTLAAGWATFAPADDVRFLGVWRQRWFTLRAPMSDPKSIASIPIYSTIGANFNATSPAPTTLQVGTASLSFDGCTRATLNYTFTRGLNAGLSGTTQLSHDSNAQACDVSTLAITGRVALAGNLTDLSVIAGDDALAVAADGTFSAPRGAGEPILAWVMHKDGYAAAVGFIDPAAASIRIDVHSSAMALMYLGLGSTYLPMVAKRTLIATLDTAPATATFAEAIQTRLRANPRAFDEFDETIAAALQTALATIRSTTAMANLRAEIKSLAAAASPGNGAAAEAAGDAAQLINISPSEQSGLSVLQTPDNSGIVVQNSKRREAIAQVYKRAVVDEDGKRTDLTPMGVVHDFVPVPPTAAISAFNIVDILLGKTPPLAPVLSAPMPLSNDPGVTRTDFDVVVLTPVFGQRNVSDLADARFNAVRDDLNTRLDNLYVRAGMQLTLGTLLEAFGVRGFQAAGPAFDAWLESFIATPSPSLAEFLLSLKTGDMYLRAAQRFIASVVDGIGRLPTAGEIAGAANEGLLGSKAMAKILEVADPAMAKMVAQKNLSIAMQRAKMTALRVSAAVTAIVSGADVVAQLADFSTGSAINVYSVNLLQPRVRLEPQNATMNLGDTLSLKATVSGYTDDPNITYSWALTSGDQSILRDSAGHSVVGNGAFDSTSNEVNFLTDNFITRSDVAHQVEVQVYYKTSSGAYQFVGKASTSISINGFQVQLIPDQVTMGHNKQRAFGIGVTPFPDNAILAKFQYDWSADTNGRCGTLTSAGVSNSASTPVVSTHSAHATYAGDATNPPNCAGDIVHVALFTMDNGVRTDLGSADAVIVFTDFDINFPAIAPVQIDSTTTIAATLNPPAPVDASVVWTWSVSGNGSLQSQNDNGGLGSSIALRAGSIVGTATVTVRAKVTLANGLVETLSPVSRQVQVVNTGVTPVISGATQYYTTDRCSIAYVTLPRLSGKNHYRITGVSGQHPLGNGPSNTTGGLTAMEPLHVFNGLIYDVLDQTAAVSCLQSPLSSTLLGDATTLRLVLARALIIDGNSTPSWTAAWEAEFRAAYGSVVINAEAFHSDTTP